MPIQTTELERYYLLNGFATADGGDLAFVEGPIYVASEVDALLLQRDQEIARLRKAEEQFVEETRLVDHLSLECERLSVELAAAGKPNDYDEARRYLTALLAHVAPQCQPLSTLTGLATQIDNYIAGVLVHKNTSRPPSNPHNTRFT